MLKIDLSGKIVLVTGASGELGRVISLTLAQCGADVAVHYHQNRQRAELVVDNIRKLGVRVCLVGADLTKPDAVQAMQKQVEKELGAPDILVNNAVAQYKWTHVLEQDIEAYESQFRSCVMQNVLMAKSFVPAMIQKKWGRIVAVNTECAMQNLPVQSAYVAGKRAWTVSCGSWPRKSECTESP